MDRGSLVIPQPARLLGRVGAWLIDGILLVALGLLASLLLGTWCAPLGVFSQLTGLVAAILYTAVLNSRIGGGQTLGKRLFEIQVVGADGRPVSFANSLGRSVVLWIAAAQLRETRDIALQSGSAAVVIALSFLARAAGLAMAYLLLFNRPTRQGPHDLIAGTFVVEKGRVPTVIAAPPGREHWYVLAGLLVLMAAVIAVQAPSQWRQVADFRNVEQHLRQIDGFQQLRHFEESGRTLKVGVRLKRPPESFEAVQRRVAGIVLSAFPTADNRIDRMEVAVGCTCDFGILGRWVKSSGGIEESREATVAEWRGLSAQ